MRLRFVGLIAAMLACYLLPWVINPGVSLTFGGYDLGEWTSLHDAVRGEQPPLLTSFLLRLPLALVALLVGWGLRRDKAIRAVVVLVIAGALLPPLEFLDAPNDSNYRQQALIAGIALVGGLIGVSGVLRRAQRVIFAALCALGIAAVIIGLANALRLMQSFALPVSVGAGGVLLAGLFALSAVNAGLTNQKDGAAPVP